MRIVFLLALSAILSPVHGQGPIAGQPDKANERVEVVQVDSTLSATELYRTAERWFVDTFKDAQEVIQLRDSTSHTIVGKGAEMTYFVTTGIAGVVVPMTYRYSVEVTTKAGRYRYRVYDWTIDTGGGSLPLNSDSCCYGDCNYAGSGKNQAKKLREGHLLMCSSIAANREALIRSLKAAMSKPKEDW